MHQTKADRIRNAKVPLSTGEHGTRLPPGQVVTEKFPILHEGEIPEYNLDNWTLRISGLVGQERILSYRDVMALPQKQVVSDIHCVTRWSKFDTAWEGVVFTDLFETLQVSSQARYVMAHGDNDYTAIIPLEDLLNPSVLMAHTYAGQPLTPKHGWPLRLVVPHLYFWKSVKWLRGFEFLREYKDGYWEERGFHAYGDPFQEQRFTDENDEMPEDEWMKKEFD